jgi:hypothetical protein
MTAARKGEKVKKNPRLSGDLINLIGGYGPMRLRITSLAYNHTRLPE